MPTTYETVPGDLVTITDEIVAGHHPDLVEARARIGFLFARNPDGAAVKLHGYPCKATIKVNSLKDRAEGKPDATITVDGDGWLDWGDEERRAVVDHELYHLVVKRDKQGVVERDDLDRPKLKTRLHDMVLGGFSEIAKRHGEAAPEVQQARALADGFGQLLWDWAEPSRREGHRKARAPGLAASATA